MAEARFYFGLQPLLDLRERAEKEKQRVVGGIQAEVNQLMEKVREAERAIREENRKLTARQLTGKLDLAYIANEKMYVGTLQLLIVQTLQKLALVERRMMVAKGELLAAARERKVIEKLRERQYERWLLEQRRREAAEMDEIGTQIAVRSRLEETVDVEL